MKKKKLINKKKQKQPQELSDKQKIVDKGIKGELCPAESAQLREDFHNLTGYYPEDFIDKFFPKQPTGWQKLCRWFVTLVGLLAALVQIMEYLNIKNPFARL